MLTPQDLQEVSFEKAKIGGYVMKNVDEFLEPLMDDYITLYKENAVLKSKMRLLVERLEAYRASEGKMKAEADAARKEQERLLEEARRKGDEILAKANRDAASLSRNADAGLSAESDRLRLAKEATAEFVQAVEAEMARQQKALDAIKKLDLPAPRNVRKAYDYEAEETRAKPKAEGVDKAEDIAAQIEQTVASITGDNPRIKPEVKSDPKAVTRVMPALDERTTEKFANLKFGKNYQP